MGRYGLVVSVFSGTMAHQYLMFSFSSDGVCCTPMEGIQIVQKAAYRSSGSSISSTGGLCAHEEHLTVYLQAAAHCPGSVNWIFECLCDRSVALGLRVSWARDIHMEWAAMIMFASRVGAVPIIYHHHADRLD